MKKGLNIFVAWLITLAVVTVGGVLPHHHEANGGICFSTEHAHHHSSQDEKGCPLDSELLASLHHSISEEHGSRCGLCDHHHAGDHQLLLFFSTNAPLLAAPEGRTTHTVYDPNIPTLCSSWAKGVSLRAPPAC